MKNQGFDNRYAMWLCEVREWAAKHKITPEQAVSVLFFDNMGGIPRDELYWTECNDFAIKFRYHRKASWLKRLFRHLTFRGTKA